MDIQAIIAQAKAYILSQGYHPVTLYMEDAHQIYLYRFANFPGTTRERQHTLCSLGFAYRKEFADKPIQHLSLVAEAWVSTTTRGERPTYRRPSEDPDRKELLIILHLDATCRISDLYRMEMIRDESGSLADLLTPETVRNVQDNILPCFLDGMQGTNVRKRRAL